MADPAAVHYRDRSGHRRGEKQRAVPDAWLGLAFTPRGDLVYVGGGSKASVFEFTFANGALTPARNLRRAIAG